MKEKNKIYTAIDLARYHAGTMPADKMHALEKAALEDPFLEDALEGYVYTTSAGSDIEELEDRLTAKRKKKNLFSISSFAENKWWRIAALFIVIAGAGYFFYRVDYSSKEMSLAKNEIKTSAENKDSIAPVQADTTAAKDDVAFENQQLSKFAPKKKTVAPMIPQMGETIQYKASAQRQDVISQNKSTDSSYPDNIRQRKPGKELQARVPTEYVLRGKVTDEIGNAVPFTTITDKASNKATVSDTAGEFSFRSKDSSITAMASAPGYQSKSFTLKKDAQSSIPMDKTNAVFNREVVVTGYGGKRKKLKVPDSVAESLNGKVAGAQVLALPQPYGGPEKFNQYIQENLSPVYDENNKLLTGTVLLSFTINKRGKPENIKVLNSSCEACEKEAIELLENGPAWTGKPNTPGTVEIKF